MKLMQLLHLQLNDRSSEVNNDTMRILCSVIDDNDSVLTGTVSPPMATILDDEEGNMLKPAAQPMPMILEEAENLVKDDESTIVEPEVEVVNGSDITMTDPKDVKFRKLVYLSECWDDPSLILDWDIKGGRKFKCVKARLNCHECGIMTCVTGYDSVYESVLVDTDTWFDRDFMDAFFSLVYHTHHFRARVAATLMSYPEYMWMRFPEEEWKQSVPPIIKTVYHPKSDHLVVLLYHENTSQSWKSISQISK